MTSGERLHPAPRYRLWRNLCPVVAYDSVHVILSTAAALDLELIQLDLKKAFLHGNVEEELYLQQPDVLINPENKSNVCLLKKSIYGLKQAPRVWNQECYKFLIMFGLTRSTTDPCVYFHRQQGGDYVYRHLG